VYGAFVKVEKQIALDVKSELIPVEHSLKNPRCIISMPDRILGLTLAVVEQVALGFKDVFVDMMDDGVPGIGPRWCNSETLGEWARAAADVCGPCFLISGDAERFDAHTKANARKFGTEVCINSRKFAVNAIKAFMQPRKAKVKSRMGLSFDLPGVQRLTGEGPTDYENSEITLGIILFCIFYDFEDVERYLGKVCFAVTCGDDNFTIINQRFLNYVCWKAGVPDVNTLISQRALLMGYKVTTTCHVEWYEAEFCSKLFYPVVEERTTFVLGGKIGRVLAKAGWFFRNTENPIRPASISLLRDNYHVPFLREYFKRVVDLSVGMPEYGRDRPHAWHTSRNFGDDDYSDETWSFVTSRYGLTPQDLEEFSYLLAECHSLPVVVNWSHLARCIEIDNA